MTKLKVEMLKFIFEYITMSKDSSARYYPKNKERTHEIRYQYLSEEKKMR